MLFKVVPNSFFIFSGERPPFSASLFITFPAASAALCTYFSVFFYVFFLFFFFLFRFVSHLFVLYCFGCFHER